MSNDVWAKKNRRPKGCAAFRFWLRCSSGDAPSLRLARTEKRRNKRGRIYETEYLACLPGREGPEVTGPSDFDFDPLTQKFRTRVQDVHIENGFDPRGEFANT